MTSVSVSKIFTEISKKILKVEEATVIYHFCCSTPQSTRWASATDDEARKSSPDARDKYYQDG